MSVFKRLIYTKYTILPFSSNICKINYFGTDKGNTPNLEYQGRQNEPLKTKKARLLYQSRKRGMLENCLLLSTFAAKYLDSMNEEQIVLYDKLINKPSNDWDIFYWAIGNKPTPKEYDNIIMNMLKEHVRNDNKESRLFQPELN